MEPRPLHRNILVFFPAFFCYKKAWVENFTFVPDKKNKNIGVMSMREYLQLKKRGGAG